MIAASSTVGRPFQAYLKLLVNLHDLIAEGRGDDVDADALRDDMDLYWRQMTQEEKDLADLLSESLYFTYSVTK